MKILFVAEIDACNSNHVRAALAHAGNCNHVTVAAVSPLFSSAWEWFSVASVTDWSELTERDRREAQHAARTAAHEVGTTVRSDFCVLPSWRAVRAKAPTYDTVIVGKRPKRPVDRFWTMRFKALSSG